MPAPRVPFCKLACRPYRRRFLRPLVTACGTWKIREGLIVRWEDGDGCVGYGEAAPVPGFSNETVTEMAAWAREAGNTPRASRLNKIPARLPTLRWAVACAQAMGAGLLAKPARSKPMEVAALLPAGAEAVAVLARQAAQGYRVFKWKIGIRSVSEEGEIFENLLTRLPRGGRLRLDANGGLDARGFRLWAMRMSEQDVGDLVIEFLEQPFPARRPLSSWRNSTQQSPVPVALDEGVAGFTALRRVHAARWSGPLVVKPSLLGELENFVRWRARVQADLVYSSAFETSIGLHAALWLAATDPGPTRRALGFGTLDAFADDGLQWPIHAPGPRITFTQPSMEEFSALWNRLPH